MINKSPVFSDIRVRFKSSIARSIRFAMIYLLIFGITVYFLLVPLRLEGAAEERFGPPRIEVSGTGKIAAPPDFATITLGVEKEGRTATEALRANAESMNALMAKLKNHGIALKQIQTSRFSVTPKYNEPRRNARGVVDDPDFIRRIVGYNVSNSVYVKVRELSKLGSILDSVIEAGANEIRGISFGVENPDKFHDESMRRAMDDAKRKANLLAHESGVLVGSPILIQASEGRVSVYQFDLLQSCPNPSYSPSPTPIAGGEIDFTMTVQVTYTLIEPK